MISSSSFSHNILFQSITGFSQMRNCFSQQGRVILLSLRAMRCWYIYSIHVEHTQHCAVVRMGQNAVSFRSILVFKENALQESWGQTR